MTNNKLAIVGAGGHGKVVADCAKLMGQWQDIDFFDDRLKDNKSIDALLNNYDVNIDIFIAIGNNKIREELFTKFHQAKFNMPNIIHPSAIIAENVILGYGNVLIAGAIINFDAKIGNANIINTAASVDHDCVLEDFVHIAPGARLAGNVKIGKRTWVGMGSSIIENVKIGKDVIIGAGSVVISDIKNNKKVKGAPAK